MVVLFLLKGAIVDLLEIIGLIVGLVFGIPVIIIIIFKWFVEGQAISAVLESFGVHPVIIGIISIIGIIALIRMVAEVLPF